ncbi:hypothetical protein DCC62_19930 [candidate division KSB1 bacterium]|nr:MAG: hypothetical protein DCC62_19930 [candidate division KSB1 bacterium]
MYRKIEDFNKDWAYESEATLKMIKNLTEASLNQRVTSEGRSLGFLAWHLIVTHAEMLTLAGLTIPAPGEPDNVPASAAEIAAAYERSARSVAEQVAKNWSDASLLQEVEMYGEKWTLGYTLASLIRHEAGLAYSSRGASSRPDDGAHAAGGFAGAGRLWPVAGRMGAIRHAGAAMMPTRCFDENTSTLVVK